MEFDAGFHENITSQVIVAFDNCLENEPRIKPSAYKALLQNFDNNLDHSYGSSSNLLYEIPSGGYIDQFDAYAYESSRNFDLHQRKSSTEYGVGCGQVLDNFKSGGYMNLFDRYSINVMGDQNYFPYSFQTLKPVNVSVPDDISSMTMESKHNKEVAALNKNGPCPKRTFKKNKKPSAVKKQWTPEEDRRLVQLVEQYGVKKWSIIVQMLPGRIGKQCRERWHNHLKPDIKKDIWCEEEDMVLIQAHAEIGNKWAEIAKRLSGRTENSIKNHWNATKRRQFSKRRKCRSKYPEQSLLQDYIKSLNTDALKIDYRRKGAKNVAVTINKYSNKGSIQPQKYSEFNTDIENYLVPNYDFEAVPDINFDDKTFQDDYDIDVLLDEFSCVPVLDGKRPEID